MPVYDGRGGLDQADVRLPLHGRGQTHQGLAFHQAIGVQHDHVGVRRPETPHPVGDVARLARDVLRAMAIEDAQRRAQTPFQLSEKGVLAGLDDRVGGVAEHEEVERSAGAGGVDRFADRLQPREDRPRRLVIDRQQNGRAAGQDGQRPIGIQTQVARRAPKPTKKPASADRKEKADQAKSSPTSSRINRSRGPIVSAPSTR